MSGSRHHRWAAAARVLPRGLCGIVEQARRAVGCLCPASGFL